MENPDSINANEIDRALSKLEPTQKESAISEINIILQAVALKNGTAPEVAQIHSLLMKLENKELSSEEAEKVIGEASALAARVQNPTQ